MKTHGRTALRHLFGLLAVTLLVQGCGAVAVSRHPARHKKTQANTAVGYFHGPLPALDAVQFLSPDQGFLAGQGIVLATGDGGQTWTRIYSGTQTIEAIAFLSLKSGYALTGSGQILAWTGGSTWQRVAASLGPASAFALDGSSLGQILTVKGTLYQATGPDGPWQAESLEGVSAVSFSGGTTGWAVTQGQNAAPEVWLTQDGGSTWTQSYSPSLGQAQGWTASIAASGDTAWLLLTSSSGQVEHQPYVAYVTHDLGQHWQEILGAALFAQQGMYQPAPESLYGLQAGPLAGTAQSAYFLSWQPGSPNDTLALTATGDGGQTWRQLPLTSVPHAATPYFFQPLALTALPGGTLWLAGSRSGSGKVLVSHDGGASWQSPTF